MGISMPKNLWFDLNFPEYIKEDPGRGSSKEIKQDVEKSLVLVVLHSKGRPLHIITANEPK